MGTSWTRVAGWSGFLVVAAGAFGAHLLDARLSEEMRDIFETAVRYHAWHTLALLLVARLDEPRRAARVAAIAFLGGILVFSGSLYLLALTEIRWLGAVTPIGGLLFLFGWATLGTGGIPRLSRRPLGARDSSP